MSANKRSWAARRADGDFVLSTAVCRAIHGSGKRGGARFRGRGGENGVDSLFSAAVPGKRGALSLSL